MTEGKYHRPPGRSPPGRATLLAAGIAVLPSVWFLAWTDPHPDEVWRWVLAGRPLSEIAGLALGARNWAQGFGPWLFLLALHLPVRFGVSLFALKWAAAVGHAVLCGVVLRAMARRWGLPVAVSGFAAWVLSPMFRQSGLDATEYTAVVAISVWLFLRAWDGRLGWREAAAMGFVLGGLHPAAIPFVGLLSLALVRAPKDLPRAAAAAGMAALWLVPHFLTVGRADGRMLLGAAPGGAAETAKDLVRLYKALFLLYDGPPILRNAGVVVAVVLVAAGFFHPSTKGRRPILAVFVLGPAVVLLSLRATGTWIGNWRYYQWALPGLLLSLSLGGMRKGWRPVLAAFLVLEAIVLAHTFRDDPRREGMREVLAWAARAAPKAPRIHREPYTALSAALYDPGGTDLYWAPDSEALRSFRFQYPAYFADPFGIGIAETPADLPPRFVWIGSGRGDAPRRAARAFAESVERAGYAAAGAGTFRGGKAAVVWVRLTTDSSPPRTPRSARPPPKGRAGGRRRP